MTFKKLLLIMTAAFTAIIMLLLGTSYAWYQFDNAVTSFTDVQTFSDDLDMAVVFTNSDNINTFVGVPIFSNEVSSKASKTIFTMTPSSEEIGKKDVAFQISLINIEIDEELKNSPFFNYSLLETVGDTTTTIASGTFENFNDKSLVLKEMTEISSTSDKYKPDVTYSYEFRIWLQDNGCTMEQINSGVCESQNNLMGKKITGKIKVSVAVR